MLALLLLLVVLVLLFGGLGLFVARIFLIGLVLAAIVGILAGWSRRGGTTV